MLFLFVVVVWFGLNLFFVFETGPLIALASLELIMEDGLEFLTSCIHLPRAEIPGVYYQVWLRLSAFLGPLILPQGWDIYTLGTLAWSCTFQTLKS